MQISLASYWYEALGYFCWVDVSMDQFIHLSSCCCFFFCCVVVVIVVAVVVAVPIRS